MNAIGQVKNTITNMQRQRSAGRLVKGSLRSQVGRGTIGFASQEPVQEIRDDGTLVLYNGTLIEQGHVEEMKPRAGYRIWERTAGRA